MKIRSLVALPICAILLGGLVACGGGKSAANTASNAAGAVQSAAGNAAGAMQNAAGSAANSAQSAAGNLTKPNCGAVQAVWVNTSTHVYHEPSDPMYGNTKHGKYMCPSQAKAEGDRPAGGGKHHKSSM